MSEAPRNFRAEHDARDAKRGRRAFVQSRGEEAAVVRKAEIDALPVVQWRGLKNDKPPRTLYTMRCVQCGRDRNVPEGVPWCLMSLKRFYCVWCMQRG